MRKLTNVEIEGLDLKDYPNFHKAYVAYAEDENGIPLTTGQLNKINRSDRTFKDMVEEFYLDQIITKGGP
jgi:hypothetical protein